jgi:hypothetical protein
MAGLLDWTGLLERLPKPRAEDVKAVRRSLEKLRKGESEPSYGLLGPSDEQLARMRAERNLPYAEPPSPMVSLGRGATDLWEPVKQAFLNATDPTQAQSYRQQRAEDERLYQRGLQWANPQAGFVPERDDVWRGQVHQLPLLLAGLMAPPLGVPQMALSATATQNFLDAMNAVRRRYGIGE